MMKLKKGIASVLANRLASHSEVTPCPHCGRSPISDSLSFIELAGRLLCGCVLLCALATGCLLATHWIEGVEHNFFHHLPWHEPFEDWML
jgi:hypothetical protein